MTEIESVQDQTVSSLGTLIKRGGIYYSVPSNSKQQVIEFLAKKLPLPNTVSQENLVKAIMEREALMSTGMGGGIAIPHPRNHLVEKEEEQFASLVFLENPIDWKALDGKAVDTLFIIIAASAKFHLHTLSAITYLCRDEGFQKLLKEKATKEALLQYINETEQNWL